MGFVHALSTNYLTLAFYTAGRFGVPRPIFYSEMASPDIIAMADANKHYGILNQVYGTPTFVINGFKAESLTQTSTLQDWQAVLNPLLS